MLAISMKLNSKGLKLFFLRFLKPYQNILYFCSLKNANFCKSFNSTNYKSTNYKQKK